MARRVPSEITKKAATSVACRFAAEFWRDIAPQLENAGRLTELDYPAFEMGCMAYGALRACEMQIAEEGETIMTYQERGDHQRIVKHPASAARNEHSRRFLDFCDRFGLSPKARGMLRPTGDGEDRGAPGGLLD